ncbi:MAG: GntR family transcriptional regulator [Pseudomonadota bacterium]
MSTKSADNSGQEDAGNLEKSPNSASQPQNGRPGSLVQLVVDGIIQGVARGRYVAGQRLIATDLAQEFDVSRAPVREALAVLAGEGVVDVVPNRGAQIRRLNVTELSDFLEFTEAICRLGIRRAMPVIHLAESRATMDEAFEAIEKQGARQFFPDFVNALYEYHETLNKLSGNTFLDFFYRRPYFTFYNRMLADLVPSDAVRWDKYLDNYRAIHHKILSGNGERAEAEFISHIGWVLKIMHEAAGERR